MLIIILQLDLKKDTMTELLEKTLFAEGRIDKTRTIGMIFDIDELLFDNRRDIFLAYRSLLDSRNIPLKRGETFPGKNLFGVISGVKERYFIKDDIEMLIKERRERYIEILKKTDSEIKPGVKEIFTFLSQNKDRLNIRLAYATSSEKAFVDIILKRIFQQCNLSCYDNPDEFFYYNENNCIASMCWGAGLEKKPSPMLYVKTVEKLGLSPNQCIAFEDSRSGLEAALGAGLNVVVVPSLSNKDLFEDFNTEALFKMKVCKIESLLDFLPLLQLSL